MRWMARIREWLEGPRNQRKVARHPGGGLLTYYWTGGTPQPRKVANISTQGAYIQAPDTWYPGTIITLTFQLGTSGAAVNGSGNGSGEPAAVSRAVRALVVRREAGGFGVQFLFGDRHDKAGLARFLQEAVPKGNSPEHPSSRQGGQALIEFALVLPLLFLLIMNIVNFGAFIFTWITVADAARAGADYMIMGGATLNGPSNPAFTQIQSVVQADTQSGATVCIWMNNNGTTTSSGTCTGISAPAADPEAPYFVSASVDVTYTFTPPLSAWKFSQLGIFLTLPPTTIHRRAMMRMEN